MERPQTVAAFYSLVGLAAAGAAIGDYMHHRHDPAATSDAVRMSAVYLVSFIGGAIATGSIVAFGKIEVQFSVRFNVQTLHTAWNQRHQSKIIRTEAVPASQVRFVPALFLP